jgi:hypothetical protein
MLMLSRLGYVTITRSGMRLSFLHFALLLLLARGLGVRVRGGAGFVAGVTALGDLDREAAEVALGLLDLPAAAAGDVRRMLLLLAAAVLVLLGAGDRPLLAAVAVGAVKAELFPIAAAAAVRGDAGDRDAPDAVARGDAERGDAALGCALPVGSKGGAMAVIA